VKEWRIFRAETELEELLLSLPNSISSVLNAMIMTVKNSSPCLSWTTKPYFS